MKFILYNIIVQFILFSIYDVGVSKAQQQRHNRAQQQEQLEQHRLVKQEVKFKQVAKLVRRLRVRKPILKTSMQRLSMKRGRGRRHGISSPSRWTRCASLTKRRSSSSRKYCIKSLRIIDCRGPKFPLEISTLAKSLAEVHLARLECAGIGKRMRWLP